MLHHPLVIRAAWSLVILAVALILQHETGSFLVGLVVLLAGILILNRLVSARRPRR